MTGFIFVLNYLNVGWIMYMVKWKLLIYTYTYYDQSEIDKHSAAELYLSAFLYAFYHENDFIMSFLSS